MKDKILAFTDINGQRNFENQCNKVKDQGNILIQVFNDLQPFTKIKTRNEAESLILDSIDFYDFVILKNIQLPKNDLKINVSALCDLYSIPRNEFLFKIGIDSGHVEGCESCNKPAPREGNIKVLTYTNYRPFSKYLTWVNGFFDLDLKEIEIHKDSFNTYLENDKQIATYKHWRDLVLILMEHKKRGYLGNAGLKTIADLTGLKYVFDTQEIYIDEQKVLIETLK